jgi:hypothetical protein
MRFIDKSSHQAQGNQVIDDLLSNKWVDIQGQYIDANYNDGLCDKRYTFYIDLSMVLLQNQHHYCCYCMKKIDESDISLEHIIPHETKTQAEFNTYLVCDEFIDNVIFSKAFNKTIRIIPPAKYPHDIAYYNLVASCRSNSHCNHKRGNKKIYPLMYDTNIKIKIDYNDSGIAYSLSDKPYFQRLLNNLTGENNNKELFRKYNWFFNYYKNKANN